jgi:hypothetical protein
MPIKPLRESAGRRVHLVSGPSCCGKSTFLTKRVKDYDEVLFPQRRYLERLKSGAHFALHYNILRPYSSEFKTSLADHYRRAVLRLDRRHPRGGRGPYQADPFLQYLLYARMAIRATVLVAPRELLLERITRRDQSEPFLKQQTQRYRSEAWQEVYRSVDLAEVYGSWIEFLRAWEIPYDLVDASDQEYRVIPDEDGLLQLLGRELRR